VRTNRTVMRFYDLAAELTRGVAELAAALEPREPLLAAELRGRGPRGVAELAGQAARSTCYLPRPHSAPASPLTIYGLAYCLLTAHSYPCLLVCRPRSASIYRRRSSAWPTRCTPRPRRSTRASEAAPRQGDFLARAAVAAPAAPAGVPAPPRARASRAGGPRSRSAIARRTGHFKMIG
jgi:hypothetical protein